MHFNNKFSRLKDKYSINNSIDGTLIWKKNHENNIQATEVGGHCSRASGMPGFNLPHMSFQPSRESDPATHKLTPLLLQCWVCDNSWRYSSHSAATRKHHLSCHCSRVCCYTNPCLKTKWIGKSYFFHMCWDKHSKSRNHTCTPI